MATVIHARDQYRVESDGLQVLAASTVLDEAVTHALYAPRPVWITALEQPTGPFFKPRKAPEVTTRQRYTPAGAFCVWF